MYHRLLLLIILTLFTTVMPAAGMDSGCGAGSCVDCHQLSKEEALKLFDGKLDKVNKVEFSEVPGLWLLEVEAKGQTFPLFIDFSKKYFIPGNIFSFATGKNITADQKRELTHLPISAIPLDDAIVYGEEEAPIKVVIITDPECPYCTRLHHEVLNILNERKDIAFYVKLFPLKIHPNAYDKARSIICAKSRTMLDDSLNGKPVPPPLCDTDAVDKNIEFMQINGIRSTPTVILPDGTVSPGYKKADKLIQLIDQHR